MTSLSKTNTRRLVVAGRLIAVGLLLPQVFHLLGGKAMGEVFLPMHLPVLLAGFCLGPAFGCAVGALTPAMSTLVTGMQMPPLAMLPFMVVELMVYGAAAGIFYKKCRLPALAALVLAQIAGRAVKALALLVAADMLKLHVPGSAAAVFTGMSAGLPGLILQWAAIPVILLALKKGKLIDD